MSHSTQRPYYTLHFSSWGSEPERWPGSVLDAAHCSRIPTFLLLSPHSWATATAVIWGVKPLPQSLFLHLCLRRNFFWLLFHLRGLADLCARGERFVESGIQLPALLLTYSVILGRPLDHLEPQFPHLLLGGVGEIHRHGGMPSNHELLLPILLYYY